MCVLGICTAVPLSDLVALVTGLVEHIGDRGHVGRHAASGHWHGCGWNICTISMVGTLIWLMITTRFDLYYSVGLVARCVSKPTMDLVKAINRIMAYSYWTRGLTVCYKRQTNVKDIFKARAWVDAAYIDCPESLRSTGGQVITVNGCPVSCEIVS